MVYQKFYPLCGVATGTWDFEQFLVDVNNWASVDMSAVEPIGDSGAPDNDAPNQDRPVHADGSDLLGSREEAHHEGEEDVDERDDVHRNSGTAHAPAAGRERLTAKTLEKNACDGDEVAGEERGDEQADDGVESSGRADIDQSEENGDAQGEKNGVQWNLGTNSDDLAPGARERHAFITCECEGLTGSSGQNGNTGGNQEDDDDQSHGGGSTLGSSGLVEDCNEWISS